MLTAVARHLSITCLFVFHRFGPFALLYNKSDHLMTGPAGTVNFVSLESQCFPRLRLGKH